MKDRLPEGADQKFWAAIHGNLDMLSEARRWWDIIHGELTPHPLPDAAPVLTAALATLPADPITPADWKPWVEAITGASGLKGRALFHPLRLALTGEAEGPEMANLLPLIGHATAARRLAACVVEPAAPR